MQPQARRAPISTRQWIVGWLNTARDTRRRSPPEDGTDTVPGIRSDVFVQSLVITRIMDFWGRTGGLSVVLPYAFIDTSAGPFRASTNGASDLGFLFQTNIFGGPALTREEFQSFVPQTFSSFHLLVTTPVGTYDASSPINPSANRWMVSSTVNFSYTSDQGWTWIETYVTGQFFSDNDNYLVGGAQTLSQKPILRLEEQSAATSPTVCGSQPTPTTTSEARRAWMGWTKTTWPIRCASAWV
jgi:Putative MetA-pathway of phenol degradation